ncbi:hypothetical protein JCM8097_008701 [Rhodosporidiobolus ruineniae]
MPSPRPRPARRRLSSTLPLLALSFACAATGAQAQSASGILLDAIDTVFAFGDSYTYDGYMPENGINSFPGIGNTTGGGYNWIQYLTTPSSIYDAGSSTFNPNHSITLYDMAYAGATTNSTIVEGSEGTPDLVAQVEQWQDYFAPPSTQANWTANSTLFALWFGINDIGFSYLQKKDVNAENGAIFDTLNSQVATLYNGGARNFLFLGVPPTQRTPLVQSYGMEAVSQFAANIATYNQNLASYLSAFTSLFPGSQISLFDTQPFFTAILDSPRTYGFLEAETYCTAYAEISDQPMAMLAECAWPMSEYVWWNAYHPTWAVHRLLAIVIANSLSNPASVTTTSVVAPTPSASSNLSTTASASDVTTFTTVLPSTFIPTTSLTNTIPASAPTTTQTVTATGGVGGGSGGSNGGSRARGDVGAAGKVLLGVAVGAALALCL